MSLQPGSTLGPYELVALIGKGGMGEVYRARDPRLRREVALKILDASDSEATARFEMEARAVAAITHPNIMAVHDYGEQDGKAYVVYELLEGESLRERLRRGLLPWRNAVEIAAEIAAGLAAAHAKGIIHGDVKPENVFITTAGRVTLVDFGLARLARASGAREEVTEPIETSAGRISGTLAYMAPEMLSGEPPTASSDLFALGCVLYEMIAGRQAFASTTPVSTITKILNSEPIPMGQNALEVPPEVETIIEGCLAKQASNRFGSARDLALMLESIVSPTMRSRPITLPHARRVSSWFVVAAVAAAAIVAFAGWMIARSARAPVAIAVLPFENATSDPDAEYIADGVTENLINALSQVPALSVRARSSVFRLKGKGVSPEKAAADLNAQLIVVGRIRKRGDVLLVSTELVSPSEKRQLWGHSYDGRPERLLAIQEEIAREIIGALKVDVSTSVRERISARMPHNSEAYELYLRGRYHLNQRTESSFVEAISFFTRAIERDPAFALGYSGLADCYVLLNGYGLRKPEEVIPKAIAAAKRALELDPDLAEAHATLAAIHANHHFDWKAAEVEYRKAIALNSSYSTARQWYGGFLTAVGRFDESMEQLEAAHQLDPLSLIIPVQIGLRYYFDRRYDEAIRAYQSVFELSPDFAAANEYIGLAYRQKGMTAEAVAADLRARRARGARPEELAAAQRAFDAGGIAAFDRWALDSALESRRTSYVSPVEMALGYTQVGDRERAIRELRQALAERASGIIWIRLEPRFDPLRDDPRFRAIDESLFGKR